MHSIPFVKQTWYSFKQTLHSVKQVQGFVKHVLRIVKQTHGIVKQIIHFVKHQMISLNGSNNTLNEFDGFVKQNRLGDRRFKIMLGEERLFCFPEKNTPREPLVAPVVEPTKRIYDGLQYGKGVPGWLRM